MTTAETTSLTDGHGRTWVNDPPLHSFRHEDSHAVMLRSQEQIEAQFGLAPEPAPPRHADTVPAPGEVHGRDDETQAMHAVGEHERRAS